MHDTPHDVGKPTTSSASLDHALDHNVAQAQATYADPYVLQSESSAMVERVAVKHGDAFMVTDTRGDLTDTVPDTGLFWLGTRYLRTCDLFLAGRPLVALSHSVSDEEGSCQIDLTNPFLVLEEGRALYQGAIHVRRLLELHGRRLTQTITLTNFDPQPVTLTFGLKLGADFRDIFEVRGLERKERGEAQPTQYSTRGATLRYRGLDQVTRITQAAFKPVADRVLNDATFWTLRLTPDKPESIHIDIVVSEFTDTAPSVTEEVAVAAVGREASARDLALPEICTDNVFFNRVLTRGMHDLTMMCTMTPQGLYPYGGIPWYVCPFGRDGLITSLEFLPWFPEVARGTLAFLAAHQGTKVDGFTEEEPGRILHEYRRGEMANTREIPFIPYYGSVDATPLFLITLESYIRWTNDMDFLRAHWPHAQAAARWMLTYGDKDGDLFLEYSRHSEKGLVNQGWKDSWDAISYASGALVEPPVALCEVQGYAYAAYHAMDYLAGRLGVGATEPHWLDIAAQLRERFVKQFWWPEEQTFYLALDGAKQPCAVVGSNAGHCLWTGIVPDELAHAVVDRLMSADLYTQWGVRTLSTQAARYNPMSYHNGSVWPHDTALAGAGFARYGRHEEAGRLLGNLYGVSLYYEGARLPELFCGFSRRHGYGPTQYPVACAPQSWAAGAPFLLLGSVLGFAPDAEHQRLFLRHPTLPDWLADVELRGLRLGDRRAHLRFVRTPQSGTAVTLTDDSEIDVHVQPR